MLKKNLFQLKIEFPMKIKKRIINNKETIIVELETIVFLDNELFFARTNIAKLNSFDLLYFMKRSNSPPRRLKRENI